MTNKERAAAIIQDILVNHLPRVKEGLEKGYVDENQILVMYDHAVRARVLTEAEKQGCRVPPWLDEALNSGDGTYKP